MMSAGQEAWLRDGLAASVKSGRPWQVLGNEVVMARVFNPPLEAQMGPAAFAKATAEMTDNQKARLKRMEVAAERHLPWTLDMWDGYPADRQRLYGIVRETRANCIVLSGDSHAFWANELYDAETGGRRVGVEFGTTGVTSPGGEDALPTVPYGELMARHNREVLWNDQKAKGFVLLTLSRSEARADFVAVSSIVEKDFTVAALKTYRARPGATGVSALSEAPARA
jgi:alkaline phosphatase D